VFVGIDLGQGSAKVSAVDSEGRLLGVRSSSYSTQSPQPGWREQSPEHWLEAVGHACTELLSHIRSKFPNERAECVGFSAAAHHGLVLDESWKPIYPCILLSDGRAVGTAAALRERMDEFVFETTGNVPGSAWTLPQFQWLANNRSDVWANRSRVTFAKDYVRLCLSGEWYTDRIEAEGSMFYDYRTGSWSVELCSLVGLSIEQMPPIFEPRAVRGVINEAGASLTSLPVGTPMIAGCSDTAAEAYAAGALVAGDVIVKLATAGNVNRITAQRIPDRRLISYSYVVDSLDYQCLATVAAAYSVRWLREILSTNPNYSFRDMDEEASLAPAGSEGVIFHPYLSGERAPFWNADLRASFVNLSAEHGRSHLIRAVYEGVAFSLRDCLEIFHESGVTIDRALLVGGGASSDIWAQIVADVLGVEMICPELSDASAGVALLARESVGEGATAVSETTATEVERIFRPNVETHGMYMKAYESYKELSLSTLQR
jgi:xylulokinase